MKGANQTEQIKNFIEMKKNSWKTEIQKQQNQKKTNNERR